MWPMFRRPLGVSVPKYLGASPPHKDFTSLFKLFAREQRVGNAFIIHPWPVDLFGSFFSAFGLTKNRASFGADHYRNC